MVNAPVRAFQQRFGASDIGKAAKTKQVEKTAKTVRTVKTDKRMKTGTGYGPDGKNRVKKAVPSDGINKSDESEQGENSSERMIQEAGEDDFDEETDAEAAAICLNCGRRRCLLDDNLPCRRYHREMRLLLARRQSESAGSQTV